MKKFLSLVLALVMTMSLVTISAGAYTDDSKVNYDEAVDVISALEVVGGYTDGSFKPQGTLTRGAAAKIICNLVLGPTTAEALVATTAPYTDVPVNSTFAGYIAYCKNQGIVSGYADGSFKPGASLTGYAFMKMLLTTLGYDQKVESYVGENWSIAVAKQAQKLDLYKGNKSFKGTNTVTREEACLYALNTLKAMPVEYLTPGSSITINGVEIVTGSSAATVVPGVADYADMLFEGDLYSTTTTDDFGRESTKWIYKDEEIGNYGKTAKFIYTAETSEKTIAADLKGYTIGDYKVSTDVKPASTSTLNGVSAYSVSPDGTKSTAKLIAGVTKNAKQVEIFVNSDKQITKILPITYSTYKVDTVTKKANGDVLYGMKKLAGSGSATITLRDYNADSANDDNFVADCDLAKGTIVTIADSVSPYYVYGTTSVSGVVTESKANDYVIVSGTKYPQANGLTATVKKDTQDLVIDQFGAVVYAEDAETDSDAVYIAYTWSKATTYGNSVTMAQIVDQKGEVTEIEVENPGALSGPGVYTYYVTSDDTAWVTVERDTAKADKLRTTSVATSTVKLTTNAGATYYFADDVSFINMKNPGAKLKVTVATGVQKVSSLTGAYAIMDDGDIITLFIPAAADTAVDKDDLLFVASTDDVGKGTDGEGKAGDMYQVYQKGEKKTVISNAPGAKGFYSYSIDSKSGRYTLTAETADVYSVTVDTDAGKVYAIAKDTFVTFPGGLTDAVLASDCEFYDTTGNDIVSLATLVDAVENNDDITALKLWAIYDSKNEVITCVYIAKV